MNFQNGIVGIALVLSLFGCGSKNDASPGAVAGGQSSGSAPGPDQIWSAQGGLSASHVRLTDVKTGSFVKDFDLGTPLAGQIAIAGGWLWPTTTAGDILQVSPQDGTITKTISIPNLALIYASSNALWAAQGSASEGSVMGPKVYRLDPSTGKVIAVIPLANSADQIDAMVIDGNSLYVLIGNGFAIYKIDLTTNKPVGFTSLNAGLYGYGNLTASDGAVWVLDQYNHKLILLNGLTLKVAARSLVSKHLGTAMIAPNSTTVYVANLQGMSVTRFDSIAPLKQTVIDVSSLGKPQDLWWQNGRLYIAFSESSSFGTVAELDPAGNVVSKTDGVYAQSFARGLY